MELRSNVDDSTMMQKGHSLFHPFGGSDLVAGPEGKGYTATRSPSTLEEMPHDACDLQKLTDTE